MSTHHPFKKTFDDLHFDHRMMHPDDCDGGHQHTVAFMAAHHVDVQEGLEWLAEHGARCDCLVVLATHPTLGQVEH